MGMLDNIQTGRENKPPRIMIYGSEGVGNIRAGSDLHPDRRRSRRNRLPEIPACTFAFRGDRRTDRAPGRSSRVPVRRCGFR